MSENRMHRAVSADGTEITGRVLGEGPPLVLVHPPVLDADIAWTGLLRHLTERFTCYLPNLRGRGSSGDSPDHSPPRFGDDVNAFVDSVGQRVCLMGWSDSCALALGAAAAGDAVAAVAAFEPSVWSLMREDDLARFGAAMQQQAEATAAGRLGDAARIFHRFVCNDDELAALDPDYLDRQAQLFPLLFRELAQRGSAEGPEPSDPEVLGRVQVPVLVLLAQQTRLSTWFRDSARYLARHLPDARLRELPGIGHFAPLAVPEPVAREVVSFFASTLAST